jgi:hypothetical protein
VILDTEVCLSGTGKRSHKKGRKFREFVRIHTSETRERNGIALLINLNSLWVGKRNKGIPYLIKRYSAKYKSEPTRMKTSSIAAAMHAIQVTAQNTPVKVTSML